MFSQLQTLFKKKKDPFELDLSDWYDLETEQFAGFSPKELAGLRDTRELRLSPVFIDDGIAFYQDGRLSCGMEVASVSFTLASPEEQQATVGGFHGLLLQLSPELDIQFKVRLTEASLESQVQCIDYAMRKSNNPLLQQRAMEVKQFYQDFPSRHSLLQRRGLCLVSLRCRELLELEKAYRERTGKRSFLFNPSRREQVSARPQTTRKNGPALTIAQQKKEEQQTARQLQEMEQQLHLQLEKHRQKLRQEAHLLLRGFAGTGMQVRMLPDWELVALFAEYLRPEMAGQVRHSSSQPVDRNSFLFRSGWYGQASPPRSTAYRLGEQSGSFVSSETCDTGAYKGGLEKAARAKATSLPDDGNKKNATLPGKAAAKPEQEKAVVGITGSGGKNGQDYSEPHSLIAKSSRYVTVSAKQNENGTGKKI